jgi:RimJ/RimL family protein N-acetyltransferase
MMIQGEKVRLRALQEEDAEDCWRWFNNWEMVRNLESRYPLSRLAERGIVERLMKPEPNDKVFAIEALDGGLYLGNVGLHRISWEDRRATFGIFIGEKAYWGKGYGTDATRAVLRFAFDEMNLNRIDLQVLDDNERGILREDRLRARGRAAPVPFPRGAVRGHGHDVDPARGVRRAARRVRAEGPDVGTGTSRTRC